MNGARCGECRRLEPACGWTVKTILDVYGPGDIRYALLCRDCDDRARVRGVLAREHVLIGSD